MNVGGVYTLAILIVCSYTRCPVVYAPRDECWKGIYTSNIDCVPLYPLFNGQYPSRRMLEGCRPFQHSSRAPIAHVERSILLAMSIAGVYTLPIFIACPFSPCRGVYTPRDECWTGVHPSNNHHLSLYSVSWGLYPGR